MRSQRVGAAVIVVVVAAAAAALRAPPERITAWTADGSLGRDAVTSDRAVTDVTQVRWSTSRRPIEWVGADPVLAPGPDGTVLVVDHRARLVDPTTGEVRWQVPTVTRPAAGTAAADVLLVAAGGRVLTLDARTGAVTRRGELDAGWHPTGAPALLVPAGDLGLLRDDHGSLLALEPDGTVRWRRDDPAVRSLAHVLRDGDDVVVVGSDALALVDRHTGALAWRRDGIRTDRAGPAPVVVTPSVVAVADVGRHELHAIDRSSGRTRWRAPLSPGSEVAALSGGALVIAPRVRPPVLSDAPALTWVDAATGGVQRIVRLAPGEQLRGVVGDDRGIAVGLPDRVVVRSPAGEIEHEIEWPAGWSFDRFAAGTAGPWVLALGDGAPLLVDRRSGRFGPRLRLPAPWLSPTASMVLVDDTVVPATTPGWRDWLDLSSGRRIDRSDWTTASVGGPTLATPWGVVLADRTTVHALESDGSRRWSYQPVAATDGHVLPLLAADDRILVAVRWSDGTRVDVLDAVTGAVLDARPNPGLDGSGGVALGRGTLVWRSGADVVAWTLTPRGRLHGPRWRSRAPGGGPVIAGDRVVIAGGAAVTVLDAATGTAVRTVDLPVVTDGEVGIVGGHALVTDGRRVLGVDLAPGGSTWDTVLAAPAASRLTVGGGLAYLVTADGDLVALDGATGEVVLRRSVALSARVAAVLVARGLVVVRIDGTTVALGPAGALDGVGPAERIEVPRPVPRGDGRADA